ncbi:MAG: response regulator, partial [Desulfamplus sp.]|nr:response regulator [Desulfamplus sp.]
MANILIVDDDIQIQKLFVSQLSRRGDLCKTAGTMHDAMALLADDNFAILFLDIYLPDGNGVDFLSAVLEEHPSLLVIMITGSNELEFIEKAIVSGAWDYLKKPFSLASLDQLIERAMVV